MNSHIHRFKTFSSLVCLTVCLCSSPATANESASSEWRNLFNGKDLTGWKPKFAGQALGTNYKNTFQVVNGTIKVSYDNYETFNGEFGHLIYQTPYSHYRLRFDYRFTGEQTKGGPRWAFRNSGVMVHSQSPESMTIEQDFPASIEVQLLGQVGTKERPTGNVCTPGSHIVINNILEKEHCINSTSETYAGDIWVTAEIEVSGNDYIKHYINDQLVLSYRFPQLDPADPEVDTTNIIKNNNLAMTGGFISF
ncbi:MAG: DUF1080 domain-containing protein [Kordiimonas sp.]